ncbi:MAG: hypothetical protein ACR2QX_03080 [Woeseiaceae bacterium]
MTRSPLFYPMHRGDADAGGAADLQTDIMRFMAILALCLVAIFALVQSIPLIPEAPTQSTEAAAPPPLLVPEPEPVAEEPDVKPTPVIEEPVQAVHLTRPKWTSTFVPQQRAVSRPVTKAPPREEELAPAAAPQPPITPTATPDTPAESTSRGFTLRFESDHALTRLVAAGKVGFYAIGNGRAQRMTVSDSRISFWDASTPVAFHQMETLTVPRPVIDALAKSGSSTTGIDWGVTLPGHLRQQLDALMRDNSGGALVIGLDGELRLEAS